MPGAQRTASGFDENVAATLAYGVGWVTGLLFFLTEKHNQLVRFHAMQSIIVFGALSLASVMLAWVPVFGTLIVAFVVIPLSAVLWLILMFKAYQGERFKLPIAGDMAERRLR